MLITTVQIREYIDTDMTDEALEERLQALELSIRSYTHNNFQVRTVRSTCSTDGESIYPVHEFVAVGDTLEISESLYNSGLCTVTELSDWNATVDKHLFSETNFLVTKVVYPKDVVIGCVNLLKWDIQNRDKVGIQSESISRHSVTYFSMDASNSVLSYPVSLLGFLEPYRKARF